MKLLRRVSKWFEIFEQETPGVKVPSFDKIISYSQLLLNLCLMCQHFWICGPTVTVTTFDFWVVYCSKFTFQLVLISVGKILKKHFKALKTNLTKKLKPYYLPSIMVVFIGLQTSKQFRWFMVPKAFLTTINAIYLWW